MKIITCAMNRQFIHRILPVFLLLTAMNIQAQGSLDKDR